MSDTKTKTTATTTATPPFAFLFFDEDGASAKPQVLSAHIVRWGDDPKPIPKVGIELYHCDYDFLANGAKPIRQTLVAKFTCDLVPATPAKPIAKSSPSSAPATPPATPPLLAISKPKLVAAFKPNGKQIDARSLPKTADADVVLHLGGKNSFPLYIPRDEDFHSHGGTYHLGMVLTRGKERYEFLGLYETSIGVATTDPPVQAMIELAANSVGAHATVATGKLGRFADPKRNPSVSPADAPKKLDDAIRAAIKAGGSGVDADGLLFDNFVGSSKRRDKIAELAKAVKLAPGDNQAEFKTSDIQLAFFVFHDIGAGIGKVAADRYKSDAALRKNEPVCGFLNTNGTYAVVSDFSHALGGTVFEWFKPGLWANGKMIGIETVPVVETDPDDSEPDFSDGTGKYAAIGWRTEYVKSLKKKTKVYYKWTHALLDTLADLYVLASARAAHLLTVVTHEEADRNYIASSVYWVYKQSELDPIIAKGGKIGNVLQNPSDVHDDPIGMDLQVFYDKITDRLNALGGLQIPKGSRYGTHPDRNVDRSNLDDGGHPGARGNMDGQMHVFPWQSDPTTATGKVRKKALDG